MQLKSVETLCSPRVHRLGALKEGLRQKWRNHLNKSRKQDLELIEGEEDAPFEAFERIYLKMMDRKQFIDLTEPSQSCALQTHLAPDQKMRVVLCEMEGEVCAGWICSALEDTAIYLWGATSNRALKTNASYLVHWRMLEWIKSRGCHSMIYMGLIRSETLGFTNSNHGSRVLMGVRFIC